MKKLLLLFAVMFSMMGAWAQSKSYTRIADFETERTNSTVYALKATRSPIYFSTEHNELAGYWTSSSQELQGSMADATLSEQQFAFLRTENTEAGKYYMYSVAGECFITTSGDKSDSPEPIAWFADVTDKDDANHQGMKLYLGVTGDNVVNMTWWSNNTAGGIRYNTNTESDAGNVFEIIACDETLSLDEAIAAIEEVEDYSKFGTLLYSPSEMEDGKYYRIQSTTRKTFTGIDGYTCNMKNQEGDANNPGQLWKYIVDGDKAYLQNVYAGLYPQYVIGGTDQTTAIGTTKDYPFTYSINNESVKNVWNISFGGRQVNVESNGNVNWWTGENAHHYIYEVEATDEELATMCMNWYNANEYVAPEPTASSYQKIDIDENATVIISPSEFAAPSVINEAIDNLADVEGTLGIEISSANDIHTLFGALSVYAPAVNTLTAYKNAVTAHGELLSIAYTPKAEWGTIILPINWAKPEGWTRYSCASTEGNVLALTEYASGASKNTPMIIQVAEDKIGTTYQMIGYSNGAANTNQTAGLLTGVLEDNTTVPAGSYVLARQKSTGKIGFFPVAENADYGLEKYKCYLTLPASESRYNALFFEGGETGILEVEDGNVKTENPVVYDLAGRRVEKAQKGLYIINGKKVVK